ncbi:hypothetical protein [Photobacterium leiognathi]|uniref:hypothetical protein n=1 Tax=Photobacterium leiognathi TaxID=553611 RepID=UPI002982288B|nr:hypothetical protein [Photobacterium leiognathi]
MKTIKMTTLAILSLALTGCVSMDGRMVNAEGENFDCSTSGGGLGLGMLVGVAAAAISNEVCEATAEEKGFLLLEDVGYAGITLDKDHTLPPLVYSVQEPAAPCVKIGDVLKTINNQLVSNNKEAKKAIFLQEGEDVELTLLRKSSVLSCAFTMSEG